MPLPLRAKNPPESLPIVTISLIVVNVLVYVLTTSGGVIREDVLQNWGLKATNFDVPHILSSMFLHASPMHIIGNMWFLYILGFSVEGRLRSAKFAAMYLASGFAGAGLHQVILGSSHPNMPSLGASGAIMGVLGAALFMFPHAQVTILWRYRTIDWPMWGIGAYYLGFDVLWALVNSNDGVGHLCHIGGAVGGLLACAAFRPKRDDEMVSQAKATLAETKDLSTLSRHELQEMHRNNPQDSVLVLHWMLKSQREPQGPKPECIKAFLDHLPRLLKEVDIRTIGPCLLALLDQNPRLLPPHELLQIGLNLERAADHRSALRFFEAVWQHGDATEADLEASLFRAGMLSESAFNNYQRAQASYQEIVRRWPMSGFAAQAKARLPIVERQLATQMSQAPH